MNRIDHVIQELISRIWPSWGHNLLGFSMDAVVHLARGGEILEDVKVVRTVRLDWYKFRRNL